MLHITATIKWVLKTGEIFNRVLFGKWGRPPLCHSVSWSPWNQEHSSKSSSSESGVQSGGSPRSRQSCQQESSWWPISKHRSHPRPFQRATRCYSPPPPGDSAVLGRNQIVSRWQLRPRCLQPQTGRRCWPFPSGCGWSCWRADSRCSPGNRPPIPPGSQPAEKSII